MENFGKFMAVVIALILSPIIGGFVVVKLWAWYVVPIFETNPLRLVEAIGLMLLVQYVSYKHVKPESDEFWESFLEKLGAVIFMAAFVLFSGWLVHLFM